MSQHTHERVNQLNQSGAVNRNVLKDLHDYIYQWTETIPAGGFRIDISDALTTIYDNYQQQLALEKAQTLQSQDSLSLKKYVEDDDFDYDDNDDDELYDDDFDDELDDEDDEDFDEDDDIYEDEDDEDY
jgi:hypothetical protein